MTAVNTGLIQSLCHGSIDASLIHDGREHRSDTVTASRQHWR